MTFLDLSPDDLNDKRDSFYVLLCCVLVIFGCYKSGTDQVKKILKVSITVMPPVLQASIVDGDIIITISQHVAERYCA